MRAEAPRIIVVPKPRVFGEANDRVLIRYAACDVELAQPLGAWVHQLVERREARHGKLGHQVGDAGVLSLLVQGLRDVAAQPFLRDHQRRELFALRGQNLQCAPVCTPRRPSWFAACKGCVVVHCAAAAQAGCGGCMTRGAGCGGCGAVRHKGDVEQGCYRCVCGEAWDDRGRGGQGMLCESEEREGGGGGLTPR